MKIASSGVYILKRKKRPVYVGYSRNLGRRVTYHPIRHDDFELFPMPLAQAKKAEPKLIRKLQPKYNTRHKCDPPILAGISLPTCVYQFAVTKASQMGLSFPKYLIRLVRLDQKREARLQKAA